MLYTPSLFQYQRRKTREVKVGDVGVGGDNPIRIQSMTIADTKDTEAVVSETMSLVEAGCEIVRITAPTIHHAENLKNIRAQLRAKGIGVPLVADIHFTPQAAMVAADYVEKVRVNPGNYADRKLFAVKEYTDSEYENELERMAEKFIPLVQKLKKNGTALRIGTNHGSLSDRIMNRYGDTPEGMVESALEFARICESEGFDQMIFSMKASSPFIMIAAYRLLVQRMNELGMDYPLHLGVTEAGEGEDGRIKSALGIGALLEDGIGDTIRVSLTEDSIHEIPVAYQLARKFNEISLSQKKQLDTTRQEPIEIAWDTITRQRRAAKEFQIGALKVGGQNPYAVFSTIEPDQTSEVIAYLKKQKEEDICPDLLLLSDPDSFDKQAKIQLSQASNHRVILGSFQGFDSTDLSALLSFTSADEALQHLKKIGLKTDHKLENILISLNTDQPIAEYRCLALGLQKIGQAHPIHLRVNAASMQNPQLEAASILAALLVDGIGDSIEIVGLPIEESTTLAFNILQASRLRIIKAEFIACPSCGRTLFNLQETTQRIKEKTAHLKGVKIAIMGCIVNGPGEMADADFGYVGGGPGKIHLYVGKECVEKNIPSQIADEKLIELIKKHDRWMDPPAA